MKKNLFLFAALATMIASCSSSDEVSKAPVNNNADAISFDVYAQRATTRAGVAGDLTTDALKTGTHKDAGFGVFAYYTDNNTYDAFATPNFMYNQQVKWVGDAWTYSPVKYWPNEYGSTAWSDDADQVSFFAYAPWVEVTPSTGVVKTDQTEGITAMTKNSATGDPLVKYVAVLDPAKCVDLCWGVANPNPGTTDGKVAWALQNGGDDQKFDAGLPFLNVKHPTTTGKMQFYFQHALSQLNVQVDAYVDGTNATNALDANTKIYIRSITFTGIATKGALNLNNTQAAKAQWLDYAGSNDLTAEEYTIYDGRKDGKEGYADGTQSNEKVTGLNTNLIQQGTTTITSGVTNTAVNLFNSATLTAPIMIIPTGEAMTVTIVYDVETEDPSLATYLSDGKTHGSSVENRITATNVFGLLENGKKYTLKLHLGMNSVKFDADVTAWTSAGDDINSNMPGN